MNRISEFFYKCNTCEDGVIKVERKEKDLKDEPGMVTVDMKVGNCCYCKDKKAGIRSVTALELLFSYHNFRKDSEKKKQKA